MLHFAEMFMEAWSDWDWKKKAAAIGAGMAGAAGAAYLGYKAGSPGNLVNHQPSHRKTSPVISPAAASSQVTSVNQLPNQQLETPPQIQQPPQQQVAQPQPQHTYQQQPEPKIYVVHQQPEQYSPFMYDRMNRQNNYQSRPGLHFGIRAKF